MQAEDLWTCVIGNVHFSKGQSRAVTWNGRALSTLALSVSLNGVEIRFNLEFTILHIKCPQTVCG